MSERITTAWISYSNEEGLPVYYEETRDDAAGTLRNHRCGAIKIMQDLWVLMDEADYIEVAKGDRLDEIRHFVNGYGSGPLI